MTTEVLEKDLILTQKVDSWVKKLFLSKIFWLSFILANFSYPIYRTLTREMPKPPTILFKLPDFSFSNEQGRPFGSKELKGKIYIANFFFTSCPSICPKLMKEFETIQRRLRGMGDSVMLVSFTVDPENDTPPVLLENARKYSANPRIWSFLTAPYNDMEKLVVNGFKVYMAEKKVNAHSSDVDDISMLDIAHSEKFVLVDKSGNVRGYYSADKQDINKLLIDVGLLANIN